MTARLRLRGEKNTQFVVSVEHNNQLTINANGVDIDQTSINRSLL